MKQVRIAINGFGRIGRTFFRAAFASPSDLPTEASAKAGASVKEGPLFDIVAINDLTDTATLAYLLKYDSVYGKYQKPVEAADGFLSVDGKKIRVLAQKDPARLPWKEMDIDIVVESSGLFTQEKKSSAHLEAGARRVVITAPSPDVTTALVGVNDDRFSEGHAMTCNASCTTNSVAPVLAILQEAFGIKKAVMTTVHGYTATQKLVDGPDTRDLRRGRAAAVNIVPSTTGAAEAVIQAIPDLAGKFDAGSVRVPTITGSLSIVSCFMEKKTDVKAVNDVFRNAAKTPRWEKILAVTEDPLVSTDIIGEPYGAIVDLGLTKVIDKDFAVVYSWYDNEAGYSATLVEHVKRVAKNL